MAKSRRLDIPFMLGDDGKEEICEGRGEEDEVEEGDVDDDDQLFEESGDEFESLALVASLGSSTYSTSPSSSSSSLSFSKSISKCEARKTTENSDEATCDGNIGDAVGGEDKGDGSILDPDLEAKLAPARTILYASHFLSAWGDRMWGFAAPMLFTSIYPDTLFPPMMFAFISNFVTFIFGAYAGSTVDETERMKLVQRTLFLQNFFLIITAALIYVLYLLNLSDDDSENGEGEEGGSETISGDFPYQNTLVVFVFGLTTIIGSIAELASVTESIAISKDWTVELCLGNRGTS